MLQNLQGALYGFVGQGSHCKMKVFSIFTIGPRSSGGSGGMLPQKILKIRHLDWLKLAFLHGKCDKIQLSSQHIHALKNKKFTVSRTEIDSIMYHGQTFNHDITHKIH